MNKRGEGDILAGKGIFYIVFLFLFFFTTAYAIKFVESGEIKILEFEKIEDSVIINRVIACISEDDNFGEIDRSKVENLDACFGDSEYSFSVYVTSEEEISYSVGYVENPRMVSRIVSYNDQIAKLTVGYNKNAAH